MALKLVKKGVRSELYDQEVSVLNVVRDLNCENLVSDPSSRFEREYCFCRGVYV